MKMTSRQSRIEALQLFLVQTKGLDRWSNGREILAGHDLAAARRQIVNRLINLRGNDAGSEAGAGRAGSNAMAWNNFRVIHKGRSIDGSSLAKILREYASSERLSVNPGTTQRMLLLRRALRRQFRDEFNKLPLSIRCSSSEHRFIEASIERKGGLVTRRAMSVGGHDFPGGTPVDLTESGRPMIRIDAESRILIAMDAVRPARLRDLRRMDALDPPDHDSLPGHDGPAPA